MEVKAVVLMLVRSHHIPRLMEAEAVNTHLVTTVLTRDGSEHGDLLSVRLVTRVVPHPSLTNLPVRAPVAHRLPQASKNTET
jgi:hypothetical protein